MISALKTFRDVLPIGLAMLAAGLGGCAMAAMEDLNGVSGKIFHANVDQQQFQLLKETVFDPKTDEGRSRHTVHWTDATRFVRVDRQNSFAGLQGKRLAHVRPLPNERNNARAEDEPFVSLDVTFLAEGEDASRRTVQAGDLIGMFEPDTNDAQHRTGTITVDGKAVPVRLRGPRAEVDIRTAVTANVLGKGFWETRIFGKRDASSRFIADRVELYPRVDPRTMDDPKLPRVLVVGDSISMNYHEAAKAAFKGVANYHRVDGNAGPSDRGVVCMELWLGDYDQPGLGWDVIQFNHGLHDLKQFYDEQTKTYGKYQIDLDAYKANLEKEIAIMRKTGATLIWCTTTPVPNSSVGYWKEGTMGRKVGADQIFNAAAMEVIARHPDILINDLNRVVREAEGLEKWWQGKDVHFWGKPEQEIVGQAVAEAIKHALKVRAEREKTTR